MIWIMNNLEIRRKKVVKKVSHSIRNDLQRESLRGNEVTEVILALKSLRGNEVTEVILALKSLRGNEMTEVIPKTKDDHA